MRRFLAQLARFGYQQALSCLYPALVFAGIAAAQVVPLPIAEYDALLIYCLALTFGFWALGLETWREVAVIFGFHLVGLALEIFKVAEGSWAYPGEGWATIGGVPLFSGFMYGAVGSYICQAWRRLDLRLAHYPAVSAAIIAVLIYANFFTHHWIADLRLYLALAMLVVLRRCWVYFTVGDTRYRMPLALSFVLIGFFLWLAENLGTLLQAWQYPDQTEVWQAVHVEKLGAWALLVTMSFVMVAAIKSREGVLYHRGAEPTVT
ncbi:MAG: DUF817 domain-containing protein [Cumulibacter sp.]